MGDTSMLCRLSMTSALPASWRAMISLLEQTGKKVEDNHYAYTGLLQ